jgi:hypothetical protein
MQHLPDNLVRAVGIVSALGGVSACLYSLYHLAMMAIRRRPTAPPNLDILEHLRVMPDAAWAHLRKAFIGILAFFVFILLTIVAGQLLPN